MKQPTEIENKINVMFHGGMRVTRKAAVKREDEYKRKVCCRLASDERRCHYIGTVPHLPTSLLQLITVLVVIASLLNVSLCETTKNTSLLIR